MTPPTLFEQIQAQGRKGGHTLVSDFTWRGAPRRILGRRSAPLVPLKFESGEAFQFDWSEEGLVVGGVLDAQWPVGP